MRTLGAVAVEVFAFILMLLEGIGEHGLRLVDLHADLGQIGQLKRGTILVDQVFQVEPVELEISVLGFEAFLGEVECLLDQIGVRVAHCFRRVVLFYVNRVQM